MKKIILILITFIITIALGSFIYLYLLAENSNMIKKETPKSKLSIEDLSCPECNLVIISLTNTRKDHIGIYGYERDTTPNIDKFFNNSLIFENAFAPASWTLPVAVSFFTSLFPYTHNVMDRYDKSKLSDEVLTFTEILKDNGYKTAAFTGGGDYNRYFNIIQGFDSYIDESNYADFNIEKLRYLSIKPLIPLANDWLKKNYTNKFFLLLQGYDSHCPFTPKPPFDKKFDPYYENDIDYSTCLWTFEQTEPIYEQGKKYWPVKTWYTKKGIKDIKLTDRDIEHMIALYDGEIAQADFHLKDFLEVIKKLDLEKNTIFIFMAEHGDLFGEHGRFMRGGPLRGTFYDPVLNFPLLIKHPKINQPIKIDLLIQTVDLMPTMLEIFNLKDKQKETRQGKSIILGITENKEINEYIYAASKYNARNNVFFSGLSIVEAIRNKEWKLIKEEIFDPDTNKKTFESYELYNISKDPKENNNLYNSNKKIADYLKEKLENWTKNIKNSY